MSWLIILSEDGEPTPKKRIFKDRLNPLESQSDQECLQRYRMDRMAIADLCQLLMQDLQRPSNRGHPLPVVTQVCAALRFFAQGAFYRVTSDTVGMSNSALSTVLHDVARALHRMKDDYIKFPEDDQELLQTKQDFFRIHRFPNVIGAIDCTHIEIIAPLKEIEADYINRKGRHSINVQAVANSRLEFTNVLAAYPGRVHDSFIWNQSQLKEVLNTDRINGHLLGDSGYPLEPHLMTPIGGGQLTRQQTRYNIAHTHTRVVIERSFGVLKMRYRCLDRTAGKLMFRPKRACRIITSCFVLHNMARKRNFYGEDITTTNQPIIEPEVNRNEEHPRAQEIRAQLILNNFN